MFSGQKKPSKSKKMSIKILSTILFITASISVFSQITFEGFIRDTLIPYQTTNSEDIDNNGTDDLIIGTIEWDTSDFFPEETKRIIEIYLQSEDGNFVLNQTFKYNTQGDVLSIDIVDLNNDNIKELIMGYSNKIGIYYQDNLHQFKKVHEYETYASVRSISYADIDGNSFIDIIANDYAHQGFKILYQNVDGTFDMKEIIPDINGYSQEPELVDINNDGRIDIIYLVNLFWDAPFYVLLNDPIEGITGKSIGILKEFKHFTFNSFEVGYVNADSLVDIVATSGGNSFWVEGVNHPQVNIFYQESDKMMEFNHKYIDAFDGPAEIKIIDMNNDNINDIVIDHNGWQTKSIYQQSISEEFLNITKLWSYPGNSTSDYSWAFGDFNNDCKIDIFIPAAGSILFYMNTTDFSCITSDNIEVNNDTKSKEVSIIVYPNPVIDKLVVTIPELNIKNMALELYNNLGVLVERQILTEKTNEINVANFPSGIYHYIIRNTNQIHTKGRLVKI